MPADVLHGSHADIEPKGGVAHGDVEECLEGLAGDDDGFPGAFDSNHLSGLVPWVDLEAFLFLGHVLGGEPCVGGLLGVLLGSLLPASWGCVPCDGPVRPSMNVELPAGLLEGGGGDADDVAGLLHWQVEQGFEGGEGDFGLPGADLDCGMCGVLIGGDVGIHGVDVDCGSGGMCDGGEHG